jgi:hypothetical protein
MLARQFFFSPGLLVCPFVLFSSFACISRGAKTPSQLEMVGGKDIPVSTHPAVIEIKSDFTDSDTESCTATVIAPQVLLTAGHCVWHQSGNARSTPQKQAAAMEFDPRDPVDDLLKAGRQRRSPFADDMEEAAKSPGARSVYFALPNAAARSSSCYVVPKGWALEAGGAGSRFDVALVFFAKPLSLPSMELFNGSKSVGSPVTFVGYGWNQAMGRDSHVKREGYNFIADISAEGVLYTYSPSGKTNLEAREAMVRDGDSGGPLVMDGKLAGVASALLYAQTRQVCRDAKGEKIPCANVTVDIGYHVDLAAPAARKFIDDSLAAFGKGSIDPSQPFTTCTPREKSAYIEMIRRTSP